MKKHIISYLLLVSAGLTTHGQELFPYTEPASNMPARSISLKGSATVGSSDGAGRQRYVPEVMAGINRNLMLHAALSFSNMQTGNLRWDGAYTYAKYRFLSRDGIHRHFRMAAFGELGYSRNNAMFDELSVAGELSGVQVGLIATQLLNKLALSSTTSVIRTWSEKRKDDIRALPDAAFAYSLSAGYLVLPVEYTSYDQLNMNIYAELLGQQSLQEDKYFVDLAPSLQFIFRSTTKLNLGYRFQLSGNAHRSLRRSFMVALEYPFLNAWKKN